MTGLTYDTGMLIAAERGDRRAWVLHHRALLRDALPTVPTIVVVEAWRGAPALARLLKGCHVEALDQRQAARAGLLHGRSAVRVEAADAVVVEGALRRGDAVVTSNRGHFEALTAGVDRRVQVIDI
ncbi:MAG: hypothetical protein ABIO67_09775 [Mycobacteriales bacterium]